MLPNRNSTGLSYPCIPEARRSTERHERTRAIMAGLVQQFNWPSGMLPRMRDDQARRLVAYLTLQRRRGL